jgi:outer membrane protein insertion porin family
MEAKVFDTVEVRGAQFIPESDIRMTCGAEVGVDYLDLELRAIEDCLMSTGVFETVKLYGEDDSLVIDVQELNTRPGRIDASLAYTSDDGVLAGLSFERYNLFDRTYGAVALQYSPTIRRLSGNLFRTEAFETELGLGFEFVAGRDAYDDLSYVHESIRAEPYLVWSIAPSTTVEGGIGIRGHRLTGVDANASRLLLQEETDGITAPYLLFSLSHKHMFGAEDGQNDWQDFGYSLSVDQYVWNIGTDDALLDTRLAARMQLPVAENLRLLVGFDASTVRGTNGNATRAIDRYFPGADSFRGFAPRGIGPRDGDDALGGNRFVKTSIELQRAFGNIFNVPFQGGLFVEYGASWGLDDTLNGAIDDDFHARSSIGVSFNFNVRGTPASLYVAVPMSQQDSDETQLVGLSLQARF